MQENIIELINYHWVYISRTTVLSPAALTIGQNVSLSTSVTWPTTTVGPDISKLDLTLTEDLKFFLVLLAIDLVEATDRWTSLPMVNCLVGHDDRDPVDGGGRIGRQTWWICNAIVAMEGGYLGVSECLEGDLTEKAWWYDILCKSTELPLSSMDLIRISEGSFGS